MASFFKLGGGATDTVANVVVLTAGTTAGSNYMTLEYPVGTDYVVPAGKTLVIGRMVHDANIAAAGFQIGYGDTGVANGASAPTTPVQLTNFFVNSVATSTNFDMMVPIPAGKYPYVRASGVASTNTATLFGVLI